jgi:site-specific DNA-methyltransferase (adenine-specific)
MQIIEKRIEELIDYENNPRHNEAAVGKVAASIEEFGFKVPIVIDKDNVIIAGHTRRKAAERLGLQTVPCIVADDLTEEQVKAFRLADNKTSEFAEWDFDKLNEELEELRDMDFDMLAFGFGDSPKIEWGDVDDLKEDNYDEPKKEMLQCPHCHHIDSKNHFKKVEADSAVELAESGEEE